MRTTLGWSVLVTLGVTAACGGDTSNRFTSNSADAGDASTGSGGLGGSNSGSGGAGAGGQVATGGSGPSTGGGTGTGGATADSGGCLAPEIPGDTALCVTVLPERITAQPLDAALDKKGEFLLQVFDSPNPVDDSKALVTRVLANTQISVDAIPTVRVVAVMPATVYVRAIFIDNAAAVNDKKGAPLRFGTWIGGTDLTNGFVAQEPLLPVQVQPLAGNSVSIPLIALRKLTVTVHASAKPLGDGQGPLNVIAVNNPDPASKPGIFGIATLACTDVSSQDVVATGVVIGDGPYWVTGILNDLGEKGDLPPGGLAALNFANNKYRIPRELDITAGDYSPTSKIDLSYVIPLAADAGAIPPNSCADLVPAGDGGVDAGP